MFLTVNRFWFFVIFIIYSDQFPLSQPLPDSHLFTHPNPSSLENRQAKTTNKKVRPERKFKNKGKSQEI